MTTRVSIPLDEDAAKPLEEWAREGGVSPQKYLQKESPGKGAPLSASTKQQNTKGQRSIERALISVSPSPDRTREAEKPLYLWRYE